MCFAAFTLGLFLDLPFRFCCLVIVLFVGDLVLSGFWHYGCFDFVVVVVAALFLVAACVDLLCCFWRLGCVGCVYLDGYCLLFCYLCCGGFCLIWVGLITL